MVIRQTAHKIPGVFTESIVGELVKSLKPAIRIRGPRVGRKQHGGPQAMIISPLDCLHNKFLVARPAATSQKEVWWNVEAIAFPYSASSRSSS